jgi:hypothetical protein
LTSIKSFIRNHPVLAYYARTFAISWGGVLLVIGALWVAVAAIAATSLAC